MLEITLCCNRDIIPTWCVRKFVSRLSYFEKNYIFACYGWYELCINRRVNHSISRPTPFVKTCNEKLKWNTDVYMRTCRCDVYKYTYVVFFLWECYVVKLYEVRINESTSCVTCRSTLLYELVMITRLNKNVNLWVCQYDVMQTYEYENIVLWACVSRIHFIRMLISVILCGWCLVNEWNVIINLQNDMVKNIQNLTTFIYIYIYISHTHTHICVCVCVWFWLWKSWVVTHQVGA